MHPATRRRLKKVLFGLLAVLSALAVLEIFARVLNLPAKPLSRYAPMSSDHYSIDDPQLFWRMKPNVRVKDQPDDNWWIETNSFGLRDDEITVPKPDGDVRIICLGESTTFGAGVQQNETYAQVAEQVLNDNAPPDQRFDVINAGLSASTSFQAWQWLRRYGESLNPDVIVLYYHDNDLMPCFTRAIFHFNRGFDLTDRELYRIRNRYAGLLYLFNHSMLYKTLRHLLIGRMALNEQLRKSKFAVENGSKQAPWPVRVPDEDRIWVWKNFKEWCATHGADLLLMHPCYSNSTEHRCLMFEWVEKNDVPLLDCIPLLKNSGIAWADLFNLPEDDHPSAVAHRLYGEALAELVQNRCHRVSD